MNTVWRALERAGEDGKPLLEGLDRAGVEIKEIAAQVQSLSADLAEDEHSLPEIDDRLFALRAQGRKHQVNVDELPRVRDELAARLSLAERQDEVLDEYKAAVAAARDLYIKAASVASAQRQKGSRKIR